MNTAEHLQRIKAKCEQLLAIAEKRTPGEWHRPQWLPDSMYLGSGSNSAFIASCAGPAEAGWRATIAAIDHHIRHGCQFWQISRRDQLALECIAAAWPEELLK